ncbi:hypothetical protein Pmani_035775 [Petrolisthes manimaculis]|uniref:Uncharacterized protein n=1 Tax=Petrolisthes manimaculis TaxID=1843537 RepID=A0AAE1NLK2_9EUCA|nr:hypothetical protein Pmani_035775 [Petrolisthes manimaculis]
MDDEVYCNIRRQLNSSSQRRKLPQIHSNDTSSPTKTRDFTIVPRDSTTAPGNEFTSAKPRAEKLTRTQRTRNRRRLCEGKQCGQFNSHSQSHSGRTNTTNCTPRETETERQAEAGSPSCGAPLACHLPGCRQNTVWAEAGRDGGKGVTAQLSPQRDSRSRNLCLGHASISLRHISFISVVRLHRYIARLLEILTSDNSAAA